MKKMKRSCSKCPKSAGPERCQYCSPENFCCVPEHGNSSSFMTDKVMCPKCSPNNFCRDPKHGNSEDNPAHKSSCRKCSHDYFNNVSNEQVSGREGGSRGNQPMHNHSRHNSYGEGRGRGGRRGPYTRECREEEKFKRHQRTCNPAVNFNPLVSTMNYEPPETRLHIIGHRLCEQCGITDISNKPDSHTRC